MLPFTHLHRCGTTRVLSRVALSSPSPSTLPSISSPSSLSSSSSLSVSQSSFGINRRSFHSSPCCLGNRMRKRPVMESFDRRLLRAMTEPVYPSEVLYPTRVKVLTSYQEYRVDWLEHLKWAVRGILERNEVIGFFFCTKPEDYREFMRMQQSFRKAGLMLQPWEGEDMRVAMEGTKYENVRNILNANVLLCHPYEPFTEGMPKDYVPPPKIDNVDAVKEMIRLGRTLPLINFLGGVVEDELMNRARMIEYTELGSLDSQRGQLCSLLSSIPSTTSSLLSHHQNVLGATLATYVEERRKAETQPEVALC